MQRTRYTTAILIVIGFLLALTGACKQNKESGNSKANADPLALPAYPNVEARTVDVGELDFKIGLMTGTVSQGEDEFRAAENLIKRYGPDRIIHKTYPDNFMAESETTRSLLVEMSNDPDVKAIIIAQAVPGALSAIKKIRDRGREDILFILIAPQEDPEQIAKYADLALQTDDLMRGITIIEAAKQMGATSFVHYTFPRHMSLEILARRREIFRAACKKYGLKFIDANAPDPMGDQGIAGSQKFILEDVPRMISTHGKNTCFFSTNCSMMEPLIRAALDGEAIFAEQCCPSPTHGYPGALGVRISKEDAGNMTRIRKQLGVKIAERGMTGRFGTWAVSMHMVMIEAAVELAKGKVHNKLSLTDLSMVKGFLEKAGGIKVRLGPFNKHANFLMVIAESSPL